MHFRMPYRSAIALCFLFMSLFFLHAEQYRIASVAYDRTGMTREYPLRQAVSIDTKRFFEDKAELEAYLADKLIRLRNHRIFQEAHIIPEYEQPNENDIVNVKITVKTKDTWNILGLPYPKYDSNSGFVFKLKIKDYNFFGSMRTLSGDISYEYDTKKEEEDPKHKIGGSLSFDIPFKAGPLNSNWNNDFSAKYTIGSHMPNIKFTTGVGFNLPILRTLALNFGVSQAVTHDPDYEKDNDMLYLTETASLSLPVTLAETEKWGAISWVPSTSVSFNWDPTEVSASGDGIKHTNLKGPVINAAHSIGMGQVNWIGNYRNGYSISAAQGFSYNFFARTYKTSISIDSEYYRAFKHLGFASRCRLYESFGEATEVGGYIRGVRDNLIKTDSALLLNMDLPIKVLQTNWTAWRFPQWMSWFDFEMQLSPFIDIALGNNTKAGTSYNLKDGWYGAGLEIIGYPNKMRSIQGRISAGFDVIRVAEKAGKRIGIIDKVVNKFFNTDWRTGEWYEISIGIGLHY